MKKYNFITKKFLIKEYSKNKKSSKQIARELGCGCGTIKGKLIKYNIPRRKKGHGEGHRLTQKVKNKIRQKLKGRCLSEKVKQNMSKALKGHKVSEITKEKISKILSDGRLKGRKAWNKGMTKYTDERVRNYAKNIKGKGNPMFGKPCPHARHSKYNNIWMRSSYEIAYAKYLDKKRIKWLYEPKRFDLGSNTYLPDFYLPNENKYIEIKGWWRPEGKIKFKLFKKLYPNIKIEIFDKNKLTRLRIL